MLSIEYIGATDLSGVSSAGIVHSVNIAVSLDTAQATVTCQITFKNPCIDSDYISVSGTVPDVDYTIGQPESWNHNPFIVQANTAIANICGGLTCTAELGSISHFGYYNPLSS